MPAPNSKNALYGATNSFYGNIKLAQTLLTPFKWGAWQTKSGWPEGLRERFWETDKEESKKPETKAIIIPEIIVPVIDNSDLIKRLESQISSLLKEKESRFVVAANIANASDIYEKEEKESRRQRKRRFDDDNEAFFLLMN